MALSLDARLDVRSVRPSEPARAHAVFVIGATSAPHVETRTAASRTVLALDVSGSMHGDPLAHVVRSVDAILDALAPEDEVGVVAFSDGAACVVEPVRVDAAGKRLVRARVARLAADGNTNVEEGLALASKLAGGAPGGMRRGVILLSDGVPNRGAHTADALREVVRRHRAGAGAISFFSLGYGTHHGEDVLFAIGEAGGGGYEYVADPSMCARAFARAIGAQADVVASTIELVVGPADGASIVRFLGREETRFSREGVVVVLPDMVAGSRRVVVAEVALAKPDGARFVARVADVVLRGRGPEGDTETKTDLDVEIADRPPVVDPIALRDVLLVRADLVREEARALADGGRFGAAASALRAVLAAIDACPGFVANDGSQLAEAYELLVDEAVAMERVPTADEYAAFRKGAVGTRLAMSAPDGARMRGAASSRLIGHTAGSFPKAWLVVGGVRHRLEEECVIGRTTAADVVVADASVSRRHAQVFAQGGKFLVADLGTTNPTHVNGERLARAPRELRDGDVIRVGEVEMSYSEKA